MTSPRTLRLYRASHRLLDGSRTVLLTLHTGLKACVTGFWLGVLERDALHAVADAFYSENWRYVDASYNLSGLMAWERAAIDRYFSDRTRLLLVGAGGGREVLALSKLGHEVHAFECNRDLVRTAHVLLAEHGIPASVGYAAPDTCPDVGTTFDGLIVGWGAFMLIQGRERRIELLRSMRAQTSPGAPILLSFFHRSEAERRFALTAAVANGIRRLRGRSSRVAVGDDLAPEYVHFFTREEVTAELEEAGFSLVFYGAEPYGHAVGVAA